MNQDLVWVLVFMGSLRLKTHQGIKFVLEDKICRQYSSFRQLAPTSQRYLATSSELIQVSQQLIIIICLHQINLQRSILKSNPSLLLRASLRQPELILILDIRSMKLISHCTIGYTSLPRFTTILTVIGQRLYRLTSLMYTILTLLPCSFQSCMSSSLCRKYLQCSTFSTRMEWVSGTFWLGFRIGLYSLQSCFISGYFFLVRDLMVFLVTIAIVNEIGCKFRIGISMTSSSFRPINRLLKRKEIICCLGTSYIKYLVPQRRKFQRDNSTIPMHRAQQHQVTIIPGLHHNSQMFCLTEGRGSPYIIQLLQG